MTDCNTPLTVYKGVNPLGRHMKFTEADTAKECIELLVKRYARAGNNNFTDFSEMRKAGWYIATVVRTPKGYTPEVAKILKKVSINGKIPQTLGAAKQLKAELRLPISECMRYVRYWNLKGHTERGM